MKIIIEQSGKRLVLPITPAEIQRTFEINTNEINLIGVGDVITPGNRKLSTIPLSFSILPFNITNSSDFNKNPEYYIDTINKFMDKPVKLTVTGTPINGNYIIQQFIPIRNYSNGLTECTMQLIEHKSLSYNSQSGSLVNNNSYTGNNSRPPTPSSDNWKTVTIVSGDTLWGLATKYLGNGSKYTDIWAWNKPMRSGNPSLIYPGEKVKIKNAIR